MANKNTKRNRKLSAKAGIHDHCFHTRVTYSSEGTRHTVEILDTKPGPRAFSAELAKRSADLRRWREQKAFEREEAKQKAIQEREKAKNNPQGRRTDGKNSPGNNQNKKPGSQKTPGFKPQNKKPTPATK